jgi:hypothetical protein
MDAADLQPFGSRRVLLRLRDASEYTGELRTDLLSDRAIAVFLVGADGEGSTIYIDDIVGIWETS